MSGTIGFSRFAISGGAPKRLDQALIDKFIEHRIGKQRVQRSDGAEAGWVGGDHILDLDFDLAKNVIGDAVHVGVRIDQARVPPELMRAYVHQELAALHRDGPDSRPSKKQKQAARDAAKRRAEQEIKQGRFHRMRQFPVLIDSPANLLMLASGSPTVVEHLSNLFRDTFGKRLEPLSAGRLAYALTEQSGGTRAIEQATPAAFVRRPEGLGVPGVYWTMHDPASRDFLGNEFLLWLWWTLAEGADTIELPDKTDAAVVMVKTLTLECPWGATGKETIACDGPTRLPEARRAVATGKLPRKAGLIIQRQGWQYELTLSAESFAVSSAVMNDTTGGDGGDGPHDPIERIGQIRHLCQTLELLFATFIRRRIGSAWNDDLAKVSKWLRDPDR